LIFDLISEMIELQSLIFLVVYHQFASVFVSFSGSMYRKNKQPEKAPTEEPKKEEEEEEKPTGREQTIIKLAMRDVSDMEVDKTVKVDVKKLTKDERKKVSY